MQSFQAGGTRAHGVAWGVEQGNVRSSEPRSDPVELTTLAYCLVLPASLDQAVVGKEVVVRLNSGIDYRGKYINHKARRLSG